MKKMIWAFFVSVFCIPTFATECVRIEPDVIFDTFFDDQDTQINVLNTYLHEIENGQCKNVAAVDAKGLWNLCKAAKINIKTPEGKTDCSDKIKYMLEYSTTVANKFYPVCDFEKDQNDNYLEKDLKKIPTGSKIECAEYLGDTSVNMNQAIALVQMAMETFYISDLECNNKFRLKNTPGDGRSYFLQCHSSIANTYFEFAFKSLVEYDEGYAIQEILKFINVVFLCNFDEKNQTCILNETDYKNLVSKLPIFGIKNFKVYDFGNYGKWGIEFNEKYTPKEIDEKTLNKAFRNLDKTDKIILRKEAILTHGTVDFEKLSDTDKEFYALWQEYAPKNQTFDDFKAMTNGNLDDMKKMAKSWPTREEMNKHNYEALTKYTQERKALENELNKKSEEIEILKNEIALYENNNYHGQSAKKESDAKLQELYKKREILAQEFEQATRNFKNQPYPDVIDAAYSTYDPDLEKMDKKIEKIYEKNKQAKNINDEKQIAKTEEKLTKYNIKLADKYPLMNLSNVVDERTQNYTDIINDNPDIKSKLTDSNKWGALSTEEKFTVAQTIVDEYAKRHGGPVIPLQYYQSEGDKTVGFARHGSIFLSDAALDSPTELLDTLSHEQGHIIDAYLPNQGALGTQIYKVSEKSYTNKNEGSYLVSPSEQSSYSIGPEVVKAATGKEQFKYDLDHAQKNLRTEINYINAKKQK